MIVRRVTLQVIAFLVISVLGVAYVAVRYVGLGGSLLHDTYTVTADFADSGGIFSGAEVTYRGVAVGRVGDLTLRKDGVRVALKIKSNTRIPAGARAVVADRSAVGEQYVDLLPDTAGGPYLTAGSVIPRSRTATPVLVQTLVLNLDRLVNSVDRPTLVTVIDELNKAFSGTGPELQRLLDSGDALLTDANANLGQTLTLIRDGKTVLDTQTASSTAIKTWAAGLASLSAQLRTSDPDLRRLLAEGPGAALELQSLLTGLQPALGVLLSNLIVVGNIQGRRLAGLEQILVTYPASTTSGFTLLQYDPRIRQWTSHFGLELNFDPAPCKRAYTRSAPPANCTSGELAAGSGVRSAARAPSPRGGAVSGGGSSSPAAASAPPATGLGGGYDPYGAGSAMGSTGGQEQLMGSQSWKWLLLGPLTG
ncbi:MAG: ABC transporter substrate-binding protein [Pseudonocardiales bacterium]|nr:MAG: ABC transporter substrate-binding protein [Pseudonocardiales bacterium]